MEANSETQGRPTMEPLTTSDRIDAIAGALALAQADVLGATKDARNPHFGNKYADLASVWDACRPALTKQSLAVTQIPTGEGRAVRLTTLLVHKSGQWIGGTFTMTSQQDTPQAIGSCLTYLRRYSLSALVGVAPEDDDGNEASSKGAPEKYNGRDSRFIPKSTGPTPREMESEPRISPPPGRGFSPPIKDDGTVEVKEGSKISRQPRISADSLTEIAELAQRSGHDRNSLIALLIKRYNVADATQLGQGQAIDLIRTMTKKLDRADGLDGVAEYARPANDDSRP